MAGILGKLIGSLNVRTDRGPGIRTEGYVRKKRSFVIDLPTVELLENRFAGGVEISQDFSLVTVRMLCLGGGAILLGGGNETYSYPGICKALRRRKAALCDPAAAFFILSRLKRKLANHSPIIVLSSLVSDNTGSEYLFRIHRGHGGESWMLSRESVHEEKTFSLDTKLIIATAR